MNIILAMAITINGYIAGTDDDTTWVKDFEELEETVAQMGIVVMGKRTYDECMKYDAFPYKKGLNIVMTHNKDLIAQTTHTVIFTDKNPKEVIALAREKGFEHLLLIGGGHLNGSFMKEGLIDEIYLNVHPTIKANGIRLFESDFSDQNLELISNKEINDQIVQIKYKVKKKSIY